MKWIKRKRKIIRTKKWFAILPVRINEEYRWLEMVKVKQVKISFFSFWKNLNFIDN